MVPIHDSDIAQERWNQAEWQHYELWEKIEVKLKRRRNVMIAATVVAFLILSSIPILMDHWPKWIALKASRTLGDEINRLKVLAGTEGQAFRLRFADSHSLQYTVTRVPDCNSPLDAGTVVKQGTLLNPSRASGYALMSVQDGHEFGIPGLVDGICYNPLAGSVSTPTPEAISGFGIIPVKDLTAKRDDRMSLLIFKGPSAEVSFE